MNTSTSVKVPRKPEKDDPYLAISSVLELDAATEEADMRRDQLFVS